MHLQRESDTLIQVSYHTRKAFFKEKRAPDTLMIIRLKGIAEDHRFDCLRTLSSSAWKELATCQFENIEIVNFEKFKVK